MNPQAQQDARRKVEELKSKPNPKAWIAEEVLRAEEEVEYAEGTRLAGYWKAYLEEVKKHL